MYSALYYPHATIDSEPMLKTALLLWDRIEYITPWDGFKPDLRNKSSDFREGFELIAEAHPPTESEKEQAHQKVQEFLSQPLPEPFKYRLHRAAHDEEYEMYPQKFMSKTWQVLQDAKVVGGSLGNADFPTSRPAGLCLMSILADCCAGTTRTRVTDKGEAYATIAGLLTDPGRSAFDAGDSLQERLVPQTLRVVDGAAIDLRRLIDFRKKESAEGGHAIRDLRHRYIDHLQSCLKNLTASGVTEGDRKEIERQFEDNMRVDLGFLRDELRIARNDLFLSKDMIVAVLAGIGAAASFLVPPIPLLAGFGAAPLTFGGVLSARNKYYTSRRDIMRKHPMAYLYELAGTR